MTGSRYRWVILATGAVGAGAFSALRMGLPSLGPAVRSEYGLTLGEVGLAFAAVTAGGMLTLVPWGALTDRIGERPVMFAGLTGSALALLGVAVASSYPVLLLGLLAAGMLGASATGASGRAVMGWFARDERGFALGIRQMALPLGGALASVTLPSLAGAHGLRAAFIALAGLSVSAALAAALLMRDPPPSATRLAPVPSPPPTRDRRLWRLGAGGALLVCAQASMLGFIVLFLHDARGVSAAGAAAALGVVQLVGAGMRIVAGRRSDREGLRIAPLRRIAGRNAVLLAALGALAGGPGVLLYPVLALAAVSTMSWNGLAFTAAAEISGRARAGTAMSFQNTVISIGGVLAPTAFGVLVEATSWTAAYVVLALAPLVAFAVLAPLEGEEDERAAARAVRRRETPEPRPVEAT
ncbi:MAG TPA: MFS transporter [Solirubrobacteraceae bacterium]